MTDSVVSEFYAPPVRDLGNPAQDAPGIVRVERWEDRMRTDVRRAVKTDTHGGRWLVIAAGPERHLRWLRDDHVRTWPVCPDVVTQAAYALAAGRSSSGHGVQAHERGDLDVTAFRTRAEQEG